jgi:hypothetical protein
MGQILLYEKPDRQVTPSLPAMGWNKRTVSGRDVEKYLIGERGTK